MDTYSLLRQWLGEQIKGYFFKLNIFSISIPVLLFSIWFLFKIHKVLLSPKLSNILNLPPSPPRIPVVGNLHQLGKLAHSSFRDLSLKYGPLMLLHLGQSPALIVSSVEMATEVMKNQDIVFSNRPFTNAANALLYGCTDIAFAPYGEYWRLVKKISVHELLSVTRVQSFKYIREEEVNVLIEKICCSCSSVINLTETLQTLTNNIVSRCVLGAKYESVHENRFGQLSKEIVKLLGDFSITDYFPSLGWMDVASGFSSKLKKASQELDIFLDRVINEHLNRHSQSHAKNEGQLEDNKKLDLMDILLLSQKDETNISRSNIKAIIMDMFVSGSHTTATVMEWAMAEFIKNPKIMKIAQDEVRRVVGKNSRVKEEDLNQMDYLKCFVKEVLRLHPPLPTLVPRVSSKSTQLAGYDIPPDTIVHINAWAIHRDSKFWNNAEEFRPERFINNPVNFKGLDFQFIPFGSGRRGCPGLSFGIAVIEFTLANLLYWFNWELPAGEKREDLDMTEASGFTVSKKIALHIVPTIYSSTC